MAQYKLTIYTDDDILVSEHCFNNWGDLEEKIGKIQAMEKEEMSNAELNQILINEDDDN